MKHSLIETIHLGTFSNGPAINFNSNTEFEYSFWIMRHFMFAITSNVFSIQYLYYEWINISLCSFFII